MNRREFLGIVGVGTFHELALNNFRCLPRSTSPAMASIVQTPESKAFGSGHFGEWINDQFGLPAYRYTCNQITDPKAVSPVHKQWRGPTDHTHQVGNDRIVAAVSNFRYVQVRQDEGSPKFLNDYSPDRGRFGAGIGFLTDGKTILSTYYPGNADSFDRVMGEGYIRKNVKGKSWEIDQVIFAPFGDDPVLISPVNITNHDSETAELRWAEYWGCHNYQFSYRSWMQADELHSDNCAELRREFSDRFTHEFHAMPDLKGLVESQRFLGRSAQDVQAWEQVQAALKKDPVGFFGGPVPELAEGAAMEDFNPPPTFLVFLDAPADGFATDGAAFFGSGGVEHPSGLSAALNNDASSTAAGSALLLERNLRLRPQESRTLFVLYGYKPHGFEVDALVKKYAADSAGLWSRSSAAWKSDGVRFSASTEPWVERESAWHNYYLRSSLTYDAFFCEHILSQGHVYQYIIGFQGAARDPLQHTLPFIFSNPEIARSVIRYTLKEIQPDGSIPYGIVGSGVPMPAIFHPSDQEMWLLWCASEYVLATRHKSFLDEKIRLYPHQTANYGDPTVRELLQRSYTHLAQEIGVGRHGLMRLSNGDWKDEVVVMRSATASQASSGEVRQQAESVLNAAMASYVLGHYARMLAFIGDTKISDEARAKAEAQRDAVRGTWQGKWFRRAWLGPQLGWLGEDHVWLEPQPWSIIGGAATPEQRATLLTSMMHPHAWPLYSAAKLLGLEFHETGLRFRPTLPLQEYEFTSPLLRFQKSKNGYAGWYAPASAGRWDIEILLPGPEAARMRQVLINGQTQPLRRAEQAIRFAGESSPAAPLRWEIT